MRIITISRQFGSGGRELGKRLADVLEWKYYDKEIIQRLVSEKGLDPDYVTNMLTSSDWQSVPITTSSTFSIFSTNDMDMKTSLLVAQREIIEDIASAGNDCIIVGRDADIILKDYKPFRIFVCADMESRLERCMKFEAKKKENRLTEKEVLKNIKRIDKNRTNIREMLTGRNWGESDMFDLTVNASRRNIKKLSEAVGQYAIKWFEDADE